MFRVNIAAAALTISTHSRHTGPRVGTRMQSGPALPRLHTRQIEIAPVERGRSPGVVASCATTPSQTATHSSQMNADEPAMSCRTALCGLLQNEQRYSRLLKKSNNESSRFTHIARSRQKEVPDSAFALACRTASLGRLQTDTVRLAPPTVAQGRLWSGRGRRIYA